MTFCENHSISYIDVCPKCEAIASLAETSKYLKYCATHHIKYESQDGKGCAYCIAADVPGTGLMDKIRAKYGVSHDAIKGILLMAGYSGPLDYTPAQKHADYFYKTLKDISRECADTPSELAEACLGYIQIVASKAIKKVEG